MKSNTPGTIIALLFFMVLVVNIFPTPEKTVTLGEIYKTGKIEFIPELTITRDSFPSDVNINLMVAFSLGKGHVFISDSRECNIKILSDTGQYIKTIGRKGKGPADLYHPSRMTFSGDRLTVSETGNRRFSVFDADGNFVNTYSPPYRGLVRSLKSIDDGRIIVERHLWGKVKGEFQEYFGLELCSGDFKTIKDLYTRPISRYCYSKKYDESFVRPFAVDVKWDNLPGNKMVIGVSSSYQLEIRDMEKRKIKTFTHTYTPAKITANDREDFFASIVQSSLEGKMSKGADKITRDNTEFPDYKPAFKSIFTDCEGNILVFNYGKMERNDLVHLAKEFDAFDSNGNFVNHVVIIAKEPISLSNLYSTPGGVFWAMVEGDLDSSIVKYKVNMTAIDKNKARKNAH